MTYSTLVYIILLLVAAVPLFSNSYILKNDEVFKLDTIKLLSRAYYLTGSKGSSKSGLEFEDSTLKTFRLESSDLDNNEELKTLFDTLQFSKTKMSIYTNKEGLANYRNQNDNDKIPALYISIGSKSFGNINAVNANKRRKLIYLLTITTVVYGIFLVAYFNRTQT